MPITERNSLNKTILVIDDEEFLVKAVVLRLNILGYNMLGATNSKKGIGEARQHHPDIIILDVSMPDMNGIEVATELEKYPETNKIPILFWTASADKETIKDITVKFNSYILEKEKGVKGILKYIEIFFKQNK
jgi:CheY-like chemotaxis protein